MQILFLLLLAFCTIWASKNFDKSVTGLRKIPENLNIGNKHIFEENKQIFIIQVAE